MSKIERSTNVRAAITDADREWTEFMFRTFMGHYQSSVADLEWSLADDVEEEGVVSLTPLDDGTRVTVTITYEGDRAAEVAVGAQLERDLAEFKRFAETRG